MEMPLTMTKEFTVDDIAENLSAEDFRALLRSETALPSVFADKGRLTFRLNFESFFDADELFFEGDFLEMVRDQYPNPSDREDRNELEAMRGALANAIAEIEAMIDGT